MRKKLLVLFLCSLLGTSASAQPKPTLIESWLEYATEHWQLAAVVGSAALVIGFGLGLAARPAQKQKPLAKPNIKMQGEDAAHEAGGPGDAARGTSMVLAAGAAAAVVAPDARFHAAQAENLRLMERIAVYESLEAKFEEAQAAEHAEKQRLREQLAAYEQRDAELERIRKEREAAANAPQTPAAAVYQGSRTRLKRTDSMVKAPAGSAAVAARTEDYSKSRGSLRKIGADENGDVARPEVAAAPLAEHQTGQFVAPAQLGLGDRLAQLTAELNQNNGHTDKAVARADLFRFLRELDPQQLRELGQNPLFWDKLMYDAEGFFERLTAEQFHELMAGFLTAIETALNGERLTRAERKLLLTNLAIINPDQAHIFTEGELNQLEELVFKRFNTFIKMLSGALDRHEGKLDDLRKKLAMLKELVGAFLKVQDARVRQSLAGPIDQFNLVVMAIEQAFKLQDTRIIRDLAARVKKLKSQDADSEKAREEILEILRKCSLFLLGELAKNEVFASKGLLENVDFLNLLSEQQKAALQPPKME